MRALLPVIPESNDLADAGPLAPRMQRLGRAATVALYDELALAPKPGLVSFADSGSHADMSAATFMRSLFALRHYFPAIAAAGAADADFAALERLGRAAETRMMRATGAVNTHRGAIFTLGLLCASAGRRSAHGLPLDAAGLRATLRQRWGADLARRPADPASNGQRAARRHGVLGAADEAAQGLPTLFDTAVPALRDAHARGLRGADARLETLFHIVSVLDDTNLVHRGGLPGLRHAQSRAREFLAAGGAARPRPIAHAHAQAIHTDFVLRRLSPGGAADLLAAACWVVRVDTLA